MIIVTLTGGLGNQLFQYVFARQVALMRSAPLKLNLSAFCDDHLRSFKLEYFNIDVPIATPQEVDNLIDIYYSKSLVARFWKFVENLKSKHKRTYYIEDDYYKFEPCWKELSKNVLIEGFWQHYGYFEHVPPIILDELTLRKEYTLNQPAVISEIEKNDAAVSIHIRRGDYVNDIHNLNFFGVLPHEYYREAIEYINGHIKEPTYYVFSDDLDWARSNLKTNAALTFVEINGGTTDYLELYAMSKCRHNIIANSSFSWWAAFLNNNPDKIVVSPERWVANPGMNSRVRLQAPSWIKI